MKKKKRILSLLLGCAFLLILTVPAAAAETAGTESPEPEGTDDVLVLDAAELEALIADFMAERNIAPDRFAMAFCYTGTGETYYYNPDQYINAASLYKLPLMMGLARKVSAGELQQTDQIYGMDISYIETRAITYSDNNVGEAMIGYFGPFRNYRLMQAEIAGIPEEELPEMYFSSNAFSVRLVMGVLRELWDNTETYPNIIECMKAANPGEYFRLTMDGQYEVAQKYGGGDGYLHTAGIIYTPTPILLVVMTYRVTNAEYAIANLAQLLADHSLTLDERRDTILAERAAEEERLAAEKAEQERLAAEQAEQERRAAQEAEAERQRLEAERAAQQQAEAAAMPAPSPEPADSGSTGALAVVLGVLGAAAAMLIAAALLTRRKQTVRR